MSESPNSMNEDAGIIELPGGGTIHYRTTQVSPEELADRKCRRARRTYRVTIASEERSRPLVSEYEVPGDWLDAFLYDWEDAPGEGQEILEIEQLAPSPGHNRCGSVGG